MKRVLVFTFEYPPDKGGIATYLHNLHGDLDNVIVARPVFWRLWPRWLPQIYQLFRMIKLQKIEVVAISHVLPLGYSAVLAKMFMGCPYVVFVHGLDVLEAKKHAWKKFWLNLILKNAKNVIANSNFTRELIADCGLTEGSVIVISPCLHNLPGTIKRQVSNKVCLLTVGRLVRRKNHFLVLDALQRLRQKYSNISYSIVGNGPMKDEIQNKIKDLELDDIVKIYDTAGDDEKQNFYRESDIFVMPTVSNEKDVEGFGIVFLEAASYGIPVVAGQGGGISEAVIHEKTGVIINAEDPDELCNALVGFIENRDWAIQLGKNGRERVENDFLCAKRIEKIKKIYG